MELIAIFQHNDDTYREYSAARNELVKLMKQEKVKVDNIGDCFDEVDIVGGEGFYNFFGKLRREFEGISELQSAILINEGFNWSGGNVFKNGIIVKGKIEVD